MWGPALQGGQGWVLTANLTGRGLMPGDEPALGEGVGR